MKILHTPEEIIELSKLQELAGELGILSKKYKNSDVLEVAEKIAHEVNNELKKYNSLIGKSVIEPGNKNSRKGIIAGNFYFSSWSRSVRTDVKYDNGAYTTKALSELEEINEP